MSQTPLRTAVLGLTEQGQLLLECAAKTQLFKIDTVADKDTELAKKIAAEYGCGHYDDYRIAVMQNGLDVVFAAAPLHTCAEYIYTALSKKLHVLRIVPPARTLNELAEFVRLADDSGTVFAIASPLRFNKTFTALREYLEQNKIENISLVTVQCGCDQHQQPWQRDPKLAGGGIFLYNCYEMADQIVQSFGMPDEVYAVHASQAPDRQQRLSVTEDTAVITMKFADTLTISVVASKILKPNTYLLNAYGREHNVFIDGDTLSIFDVQNNLLEKFEESAKLPELMFWLLENFVQSIIAPDQKELVSSGTNHLHTMALIESAYLSARTGAPESPQCILQMSQDSMARYLAK
jgi:predicted dehydrogenase